MKTVSATVTLRLPTRQKKRLRKLAEATKRSASFLAADAIGRYLDDQDLVMKELQEGIAEADAGLGIPNEEVMKWMGTWGGKGEIDVEEFIRKFSNRAKK
jgi:RHH-type rel operon transcriptional repressor/antitoxin RelB